MPLTLDYQSLFASGAFTRQQVDALKKLAATVFTDAAAAGGVVGFGLDCGDSAPNTNAPARFDMGSSA